MRTAPKADVRLTVVPGEGRSALRTGAVAEYGDRIRFLNHAGVTREYSLLFALDDDGNVLEGKLVASDDEERRAFVMCELVAVAFAYQKGLTPAPAAAVRARRLGWQLGD